MLFRSGENLFEGAKSFVDQYDEITIFSAYLKLDVLKKLNESQKVKQVIVRWEIPDLYKGISSFSDLYYYCLENNIALYRNTRLHLKAIWNNDKKVFFGSANISNRGLHEVGNYNFELNGINEAINVEDQRYLQRIIKHSEYVTESLYNKLKSTIESLELPQISFPSIPTPPPTVDYFLINQLPMTSSPELLFDLYENKDENNDEISYAAHDLELYQIPKNLNKFDNWYFNEAWNTFAEKNMVCDIFKNLINFDRNIEIISNRLEYLQNTFKIKIDKKRLGPVIVLPYNKKIKLNNLTKFFNFKKNVFNEKFRKCFILPLHFKISDQKFKKLVKLYHKI